MKPHTISENAGLWYCPVRDWHYAPRMAMDDWKAWDFCPGCGEAVPLDKRPVAIEAGVKP